jgi:hypothetical protein
MPIIEKIKQPFDKSYNWLSRHARNVSSQYGEDGVIQKIVEIIGAECRHCVEFGAWDGKLYSNTYNLLVNHGWHGVMIEGNKSKYNELKKCYAEFPRVTCLNQFVGFDSHNNLDRVLSATPTPQNFDLLSIDIDGNDLHVWAATNRYKPRVVIIEFNPAIPNDIIYIQDPDMRVNQGSSLLALTLIGKKKGYELIAVTVANAFFVIKELYPLFDMVDNSVGKMFDDDAYKTTIFQLFDGRLEIAGTNKLLWNGLSFSAEDLQVLPNEKQKFVDR